MDTAWAIAELERFAEVATPQSSRRVGPELLASYSRQGNDAIAERAVVVEQILNRVDRTWRTSVPSSSYDRWQQHREAAVRAAVQLRGAEELREKLGDDAPTLSAGGLHPWVWNGARSLWGSGHYAEAVGAAARQVNAETQTKVGRRDASETALLQQCFSDDAPAPGKPRLRLPDDDGGKSALSVRRGVRSYAEGCYAALRNPAAHDVAVEVGEHEALEQLAAFSILARWVDASSVVTS